MFKRLVRIEKKRIVKKRKQRQKMERLYDPNFLTFGRDTRGIYMQPEQRPWMSRKLPEYKPGPGDYRVDSAKKLVSTRSPEARIVMNSGFKRRQDPSPDAGQYQFGGSNRYGRMSEMRASSNRFSPLKSNRMDFALQRDSPDPGIYNTQEEFGASSRNVAISQSRRIPKSKTNSNPGPGSYNHQRGDGVTKTKMVDTKITKPYNLY